MSDHRIILFDIDGLEEKIDPKRNLIEKPIERHTLK